MAFRRNILQKLRHAVARNLFRPKLGDIYAKASPNYRRKYHRHDVSSYELAFVTIGDRTFRILNISYGGLRVRGENLEFLAPLYKSGQLVHAGIAIMGSSYKLPVRVVALDKGMAGLSFERIQSLDEQFLTRFLYFMDAGILLKSLPKGRVGDIYQNPAWHSYGGLNGAIEVHLHLDGQSEVVEAHVFYLNGLRQDVAIFTSRGISVSCMPKRELKSRDKREILVHVLCIMLGLRQVGRTDRLDALIQSGLTKLFRPSNKTI
ncbi:PilZ domain-containing protein [Oligoflexus tunisiensis]|uniref:PilZ domain-containing protein n=1 Tax=Oligoflexus tunisiensis TaxID=708132 RepID=UPI00114D2333|nr:PilZ domain-containing protein [Oligoflexus tunisiensis]